MAPSSPGSPLAIATAATGDGYAFGLDLSTDLELAVLRGRSNGHRPDRRTTIEVVPKGELDASWKRSKAQLLLERRYPSGRLVMSIHHDPDRGYRVSAPGHGTHVISVDGAHVRSALPGGTSWRWQRLLFAQVLPLAATLRGYVLLHASAVAIDERACAFIASSGTGKTSTAAHLVGRGATFVTDDVLALECTDGVVLAHPGAGMAGLYGVELQSMPKEVRARVGSPIGRGGKQYLATKPVDRALPLAAIYFLERGVGKRLAIDADATIDPQVLLSSSFIWYVASAEHLLRHLDVCARISELVHVYHLRIPANVSAGKVAAAVEAHMRDLG